MALVGPSLLMIEVKRSDPRRDSANNQKSQPRADLLDKKPRLCLASPLPQRLGNWYVHNFPRGCNLTKTLTTYYPRVRLLWENLKPRHRSVNTAGRGLRISRKDRTVEVIKLFIIWLTVNLHPAMCAVTDSFIVLDPGQNYTLCQLHHSIYVFRQKHISFREKWLLEPQKGILIHWCHNLMGNLFRLLRRNVKDKKCFKIVQTNGERKY